MTYAKLANLLPIRVIRVIRGSIMLSRLRSLRYIAFTVLLKITQR